MNQTNNIGDNNKKTHNKRSDKNIQSMRFVLHGLV